MRIILPLYLLKFGIKLPRLSGRKGEERIFRSDFFKLKIFFLKKILCSQMKMEKTLLAA